jgi:hypothetical protein
MSDPLRTPEDYELFLYTLDETFPSVRHSTLTLVRLGASLARVAGELHFNHALRLVVRERLVFDRLPVTIDWYGYEVWRGETMLYWYDPQPHPNDPALQSTHPHHKHPVPGNKQERAPAPEMSFIRANLPVLIHEIEELIGRTEGDIHDGQT